MNGILIAWQVLSYVKLADDVVLIANGRKKVENVLIETVANEFLKSIYQQNNFFSTR